MKRIVILSSLAATLVAVWVLVTIQRSSPEIAVERDLIYGKRGDTELKLDLAMPKAGDGPFPAIVFLHGGGWKAGNRQQMNHFIEGVARMGYVGITVEYRLVPAARFPAQVQDCKAAVRWLRAHARQYRINPGRIGVVGFSAGGYLASMLGVTGGKDGFDETGDNPEQSSQVQAVVSFFGPTDFSAREWSPDLEENVIVPLLGGSFTDNPDVYKWASPISYATRDASPFLFFHGSEDELVPVDQSKRLGEKLKGLGVPTQVVVLKGEGHGFTDAGNQDAMKQMMDFLGERLKK